VQCMNENNQPVDWWFVYKMPHGFEYAYYDSTNSSSILSVNGRSLNCTTECALGSTLGQLYLNKLLAHVLYNDEPDGNSEESGTGGHCKGVLTADNNGGFWLIHSVPKFPDLVPSHFTWTASTIYGQSFLCVTLDVSGVEAAASQLQYMDPDLFDSLVTSNYSATYPELYALSGGSRKTGSNVLQIVSRGGTSFTHFAKDDSWGKDLYDDLVEPYFKQAFQWETWRRAPYLPSLCPPTTQYPTLNVASISIDSFAFPYTDDHSKWGVSIKDSWSCIGGINRMESQRKRGGGTICFEDKTFWTALSKTVASSDPCS